MIFEDFKLETLTPAQYKAVTSPLESRLVLAGPGTGKTRTLVHRVVYLISEFHLPAESILAVTYTNKATEEMRHRLRRMIPNDAQRLNVGTFHSFCIRVLRQHYEKADLPKYFAVTDEDGQLSVLQRAVPTLTDRRDVRTLLGKLSTWRLSEAVQRQSLSDFQLTALDQYQKYLRSQALIDFDDILLLTETLLLKHQEVLDIYRSAFQSILVDEFQDTDTLQYRILKHLTACQTPVFAVADDDQSIFAWRGANPQNLRRFVSDFLPDDSDTCIIKLEENYRCSGPIVDAANRLIASSLRLFDKVPTAISRTGTPVRLRVYETDQAEAADIASSVENLWKTSENKLSYRDMAVLYRNHKIGELIETTLLARGVPCQVVRGNSLFDTPRIRQILALMRVQANPKDEVSLHVLLKEYLDDLVRLKVEEQAVHQNSSLRQALWKRMRASNSDPIERRQLGRVVGLLTTAKTLAEAEPKLSLADWVRSMNLYLETGDSKLESGENLKDVKRITDPLGIPALETGARWLERLAVRKGRLVITASESVLERAAFLLLHEMLEGEPFTVHALRDLENDLESSHQPTLLLALDSASELNAAKLHKFMAVLTIQSGTVSGPKSTLPRRDLPDSIVEQLYESGLQSSVFVLLWKLAQAYQGLHQSPFLPNYTVVDFETTDLDTERNDVVEIAAVRVRDGAVVAEYSKLIRPTVPISPNAEAVHRISVDMVAQAPTFEQVAQEFRDFLGQDTLVAHNGLGFDFPILIRLLKKAHLKLDNLCFDTLPMARELYPEAKKATLESLAAKFGIDTGNSHRALDDTQTLAVAFERMKTDYARQQRSRNGYEALGCLAVTMLLEWDEASALKSPLFRLGKTQWEAENTEDLVETLAQLAHERNDGTAERLRTVWHKANQQCANDASTRTQARETEGYIRLMELLKRYDHRPLDEALQEFVDFTRLFQQQDSWKERNAVTLMTIHAAKGLEFPHVWIAALEQNVLPSYQALKAEGAHRSAKIEEERRLLYVAMTRAQKQLTLSYAKQRNGYSTEASMFLQHLAL